jgi:hypothetical protein
MKKLRLLHRYMGLFFSPAILFFALTGALQTFDLHSANKSTGYVPPVWLQEMAQVHKKQTLTLKKEKAKDDSASTDDTVGNNKSAASRKSTLPMKWFVFLMSAGLIATTVLGIVMAFRFGGSQVLIWSMLIAGTLLPIAMILF